MNPLPALTDLDLRDDDAGFGALQTPRGNLPLSAVDVRARIDGLMARTVVRQTFVNAFSEPLEATYVFPLPDRAAVNRFRLKVGDRIVEGELQERAQARRTYDQAIQAGHRAAIAEEERPNVFTLRVGNLPAGESATVELTLTGPLPVDAGEATFRFPLVVAPRYIPGAPLPGESVGSGTTPDTDAAPDASRVTPPVLLPGQPNPVRLSVNVEVHAGGLHLRDYRSSLHTVQEDDVGAGRRFRLQAGERLDRDFILRFRFDDADIRTALQLQPDADNPAIGTFALTVVPPHESANASKPRDVVFVVDRSGSMQGWKMLAARRALARMIDTLTAADRFAVLAFDDRIELFPAEGGLQPATDRQRFRAAEFLTKVEARGGTEMAAPLDRALSLLAGNQETDKRDRVLVLLTDGQVGNEDQILRSLANRLHGIRIFSLGIDQAVNDAFLKRLAGLGGGYTELVESEDRLDAVMDKVHRRIRAPLLSGLQIEPAGLAIEPDTLVPDRLPDLFPGTPLTILGRYRTHEEARSVSKGMAVQATDDAGRPWTATAAGERGEVLAPAWARGHLRELEDRYATGRGDRAELEARIVATSLEHQVLCRFTAFVAVDVKEIANPGGQATRVTQPLEVPAGWEMFDRLAERAESIMYCLAGSPRGGYAGAMPMAAADCGDTTTDFDLGLPPPPAPRPSVLRRMVKTVHDSLAPSIAAAPLTAYRQRAADLLRQLEAATDRSRELGVLSQRLEELIEDLKSIGAAETDWKPLADLQTELRTFLARATSSAAEVVAMGLRCETVLSAFAGSSRRASFWK